VPHAADPDWFARGLAVAAGLVALGSLYVATKTYRRAGARVQVFSPGKMPRRFSIFHEHQGVWLEAVVRNSGLAAVEIEWARWVVDTDDPPRALRLNRGGHRLREVSPFNPDGTPAALPPPFPATVEGHHAFRWMTLPPGWDPAETGRTAYRMRLVVRLGTGRDVKSPWQIVWQGTDQGVDHAEIRRLAGWRRLV